MYPNFTFSKMNLNSIQGDIYLLVNCRDKFTVCLFTPMCLVVYWPCFMQQYMHQIPHRETDSIFSCYCIPTQSSTLEMTITLLIMITNNGLLVSVG